MSDDDRFWEDDKFNEFGDGSEKDMRARVKQARGLGLKWVLYPFDSYAYRVEDGACRRLAEVCNNMVDELSAVVFGIRTGHRPPYGNAMAVDQYVTLEPAINGLIVRHPAHMMEGREVSVFEVSQDEGSERAEAVALLGAIRAAFPIVGKHITLVEDDDG